MFIITSITQKETEALGKRDSPFFKEQLAAVAQKGSKSPF